MAHVRCVAWLTKGNAYTRLRQSGRRRGGREGRGCRIGDTYAP